MEQQIHELVNKTLSLMDIKIDSIEVKKEDENIYYIKIATPDSGIIIGPHGANLEALKKLIKTMLNKEAFEKIKIHLEVNDYLQERDNKLFEYIKAKIEYAKKSSRDFILPEFTSYERKKIHSFVQELNDPKISTKSEGEGKERRMHICVKTTSKISLDIDSNDI